MPSAWTQNFYHAVFSTKDRAAWITPDIEQRLYSYIGGILRDLGCTAYAINGMPDHVHVLVRYPANLSHSDMVRHMKFRSSKWIHEEFPSLRHFSWQEGYGGFTVSKSAVASVQQYIANQKERHTAQSYKDELNRLLVLHGIDFQESEVFR